MIRSGAIKRGLTPFVRWSSVLTTCFLASAGVAQAAAPANDGPAGATPFAAVGAENGPVASQEGLAQLAEATPDAGVPRCLGAASFNRTVWFRVPAAADPRQLTIEAVGPSGASADVPDLAAFVQPAGGSATSEPQACDGAATGGAAGSDDPSSAVSLRVPGGREVLVQVGRSGANTERAVVSLLAGPAEVLPRPVGDEAAGAPTVARDATSVVPLGGATLTQEDPAEPQCAAAGTVWRKVNAKRTGEHTLTVKGDAVGTLTAFVGKAPSAENATSCVNRTSKSGPLALKVTAKRGEAIWARLGTDTNTKDASATLAVVAPAPSPRIGITLLGSRRVARLTALRVRLSVNGDPVRGLEVRLQRRAGKRFVTVASTKRTKAAVRSGKKLTVALRRKARLRAGTYRIVVDAKAAANGRSGRTTSKLVRLR